MSSSSPGVVAIETLAELALMGDVALSVLGPDPAPQTVAGEQPPFDVEHPFWRHVRWEGPDVCALYEGPGSVGRWGHRRVTFEGRRIYAPRLAWELFGLGPIDGVLCHVCPEPNPACVAVWAGHLVDGDHHLNAQHRDLLHNTRTPRLPRGEFAWGSKLTARDVEMIKTGRQLGISVKILAQLHGVSASSIYSVLSGATYSVNQPFSGPHATPR